MVDIFGNEINNAFTNGKSVRIIFNEGDIVWISGYNVRWKPRYISEGTFSIGGSTYNFSDYPDGYFLLSNRVITQSAFEDASSITNLFTNATLIRDWAFAGCKLLSQVSLPNCISIGYGALAGCNFTQLDLPACRYISGWAFRVNQQLSMVNLPVCSYIGDYAFESAGLTNVSFPACEYISYGVFYSCRSLSMVNLPVCSYIGTSAFHLCTSLKYVSLPACKYIGALAFDLCTSLNQISLPTCEIIDFEAFYGCSSLTRIDLPVCSYISGWAFYRCIVLSEIYLGYSSVCGISLISRTFLDTPIASGTGSIYVPGSLVNQYKNATDWSEYSSQIFPIPE